MSGLICGLTMLSLLACAHTSEPEQTLYEELGAEVGVAAIVHEFLVEIAANDEVSDHFVGINIAGFRQRLESFFALSPTGPAITTDDQCRNRTQLLASSDRILTVLSKI